MPVREKGRMSTPERKCINGFALCDRDDQPHHATCALAEAEGE